ncbi:MAG: ubiquinol-cytochrome c reductase iron-sulfur subunit [Opitutaceae bacterium]
MEHQPAPPAPDRRNFLAKAAASVIGGITVLVPAASGLLVFLDPLRRKSADGGAVFVANLSAVPESGEPRKFPVLATRVDAWNRAPEVPVGAVYLQRIAGGGVRALNVACPHAGCFVDFKGARNNFHCPCHNSSFALDGKVLDPKRHSPRPLDSLETDVRGGKEVWVKFRNFRAGVPEKIPV